MPATLAPAAEGCYVEEEKGTRWLQKGQKGAEVPGLECSALRLDSGTLRGCLSLLGLYRAGECERPLPAASVPRDSASVLVWLLLYHEPC